jgi:hypothetical protein
MTDTVEALVACVECGGAFSNGMVMICSYGETFGPYCSGTCAEKALKRLRGQTS